MAITTFSPVRMARRLKGSIAAMKHNVIPVILADYQVTGFFHAREMVDNSSKWKRFPKSFFGCQNVLKHIAPDCSLMMRIFHKLVAVSKKLATFPTMIPFHFLIMAFDKSDRLAPNVSVPCARSFRNWRPLSTSALAEAFLNHGCKIITQKNVKIKKVSAPTWMVLCLGIVFVLAFCWACKPEVVKTPNREPAIEESAKVKEPPTVEVEFRDPRIPSLAYRLKRTVRGEVNYHWGLEQSPTIMYSQIHQESAWNEDAVSPVGAQGLAQFMPSTAEWIAKLYPVDLGGKANPLDARWAIRSMVLYDKFLFDRCGYASDEDNRWRFTLSAYNGGATWVQRDRSLADLNGKMSDRWTCNVEHHSNRSMSAFKENRDYVKKILDRWVPLYKGGGFV